MRKLGGRWRTGLSLVFVTDLGLMTLRGGRRAMRSPRRSRNTIIQITNSNNARIGALSNHEYPEKTIIS